MATLGLLTPSLIKDLFTCDDLFHKNTKAFAFDKGQLLISVNTGYNHFEGGSVYSKVHGDRYIKRLVSDLSIILNVLKIWQKHPVNMEIYKST